MQTRQIQELLRDSLSNPPDSNKTASNNSVDVSLQVDYASLINKAAQILPTDAEAVQRAQQLLESGQLESRQNIRQAAENIIESGI